MKVSLSCEEQRRDSYKLLSDCYYPPDEEFVEILGGVEGTWGGVYAEIARYIPEMEDVQSLEIDYAKLFVGPFELLAPPYGSVYLEGTRKVMGDSTMHVLNRYRKEGVNVHLTEPPDHIAIELEFMYFLIFKEVEALRNGDAVRAANYLAKQKTFLETHLGAWVSQFTDKVEANAQTEFYKHIARLTRSFVEYDLRNVNETGVEKGWVAPKILPRSIRVRFGNDR